MSDTIVIPEITIHEITTNGDFVHIPLEQMRLFVLQADAVILGWLCFAVGLLIGITVTYFWYRGRVKEWQPEDH